MLPPSRAISFRILQCLTRDLSPPPSLQSLPPHSHSPPPQSFLMGNYLVTSWRVFPPWTCGWSRGCKGEIPTSRPRMRIYCYEGTTHPRHDHACTHTATREPHIHDTTTHAHILQRLNHTSTSRPRMRTYCYERITRRNICTHVLYFGVLESWGAALTASSWFNLFLWLTEVASATSLVSQPRAPDRILLATIRSLYGWAPPLVHSPRALMYIAIEGAKICYIKKTCKVHGNKL